MQPKFLFALSHEALGTSRISDPVGWDGMQHTLTRDSLYHGVAIKYSVDLGFIKDGYDFLQTVYNTYGIEAEVLLIIYEVIQSTGKYEVTYTGRINLTKYVATETDCTTNAEETGFTRKLLNLESVEVDLIKLTSIDGQPLPAFAKDWERISLHSKAIIKRFEGYVSAQNPEFSFRPVSRREDTTGVLYVGFDDTRINELNAFSYQTGLDMDAGASDRNELIEFVERGDITVDYNLDLLVECILEDGDFDAATINFYMGIGKAADRTIQGPFGPITIKGEAPRIYRWDNREVYGGGDEINGDFSHAVNVSGSQTFNVNIGDKLYFYGTVQVYDTSEPFIGPYVFEWKINANAGTFLKIRGATTTDPTTANGLLLHEAFSRIIMGLTGRADAFYSEILGRTDSEPIQYAQDGEMSLIWLSNGSQVRGFPLRDTVTGSTTVLGRPIFANFKEAYSSLNALRPVGMGVELLTNGKERVRLEGVEWFYRPEVVLALSRVKDLKLSVASEYYYNQVDVGFEKWGSNQDNSLDEFNTKQSRSLAITQLKSTYSAVSKYVGSGYLLEETRRQQFSQFPDKEGNNDKTNFFVCVVRIPGGSGFDVFEPERNQNLSVCRNVMHPPSIYNARITPLRNLYRHEQLITPGLRFRMGKPVAFLEGNANYIAETQFNGEPRSIIENEPIIGNDLAAPLWIPEYYEFSAPLPLHQRQLIERNPYGIITFEDSLGNVKRGYLKEIKVNLNGPDADFKLLRANL